MMVERTNVTETIYKAVDEVNKTLPKDRQLEKNHATVLFGPSGILDSLGLVTFIVTVEQQLEADFGATITLTTADLMSADTSPLQTVGTLIDYAVCALEA